jgi:hypothetical protein
MQSNSMMDVYMNYQFVSKYRGVFSFSMIIAFALCACIPAAAPVVVEQTVVVPQTVVVQQQITKIVEIVVTATPEASSQITETPFPPLLDTLAAPPPGVENSGVMPEGFNAWCSTLDTQVAAQGWIQPVNARLVQLVDGLPELIFPAQNCTFVFTLKEPLPSGTELWLYDLGSSPWLKKSLLPVPDDPNAGYITLTHDYIVNPPVWAISYRFELHTGTNLLWSNDVNFKNAKRPTWRCRTNDTSLGPYPNPVTGHCSPDIELHPWDAGFGTPGPQG